MADRTLTINHADGGSETYTINRDKFAGVRALTIDGDNVSIYHTAVPKEQSKETTFGGSKSITVNRDIEPLLSKVVGGAAAAYSLRDLNDSQGNNNVVRVRRESDNSEKDFLAKEVSNGTMARWVNEQPTLPLDLRELDTNTGERDGALIQAAAAYSLRNLKASGTDVPPTGDSPRPVENNTDLFLPDEFPVTLQRNNEEYFIKETGADWFANYSGATLYVSPSGSDTTGDGSSSNPYQSLNTVISNASDNDIVSMSAGIYAMPTLAVSKDLAFVCPSGKAYIGTFNDLSSAQIDAVDYSGTVLHNVDDVVTGETFKGWIRTDGTLVGGVRGSAVSGTNGQAVDYQNLGVMSVFADSTSADFSTGTSETLQELVDAGSVLAWSDADTGSFRVDADTSVYIGKNITLASYGTDVVAGIGSANLILDGCEIYGGFDNCVSHPGSGSLLMFNTLVAGSNQDNIDYRGTAVAAEINITSNWCNTGVNDNASTGHDSCKVLRVGGTYRGGSRTVHDVHNTKAYVYSCTIGDAVSNDKALLVSGGGTGTLDYGDITFIDTFNDGGLTNLTINSGPTATNSELNQDWSYFAAGKYVVQVRRRSNDTVKSFTAAEVADGTLESWVGASLDIVTPTLNNGGFETAGTDGFDYWLEDTLGSSTITRDTSEFYSGTASCRFDVDSSDSFASIRTDGAFNVGTTLTYSIRAKGTSASQLLIGTNVDDSRNDTLNLTTEWQEYTGTVNPADADSYIQIKRKDSANATIWIDEVTFTINGKDGYVKTWYDQSGNTNDAVQTDTAKQPKIVENGSILEDSAGNPEIDFDGSDDGFNIDFGADLTQVNSLFLVHQSDALTDTSNEFFDSAGSATPRTLFDQSGTNYRLFSGTIADTGVALTTDQSLVSAIYNGASSLFAKNGTATGALNSGTEAINQNSTLGYSSTRFYDGTMQEFIVYNSDQSNNRTAIEANIGETYGITDIPAANDTVNGYVQTWYDQSGNGNDAVQIAADYQPKIVGEVTSGEPHAFLGAIEFDGSQQFQTITLTSSAQPSSIFSVSNTNVAGQTRGIYGTNTNQASYYRSSNKHAIYSSGTGAATLEGSAYVVDTDYLRFDLFNGANSVVGVNGTTTSGTTGNAVLNRLDIGDASLGGVNPLNGCIKELILYTNDQSANRPAIETNIANQYGITLS